MDKISVLNIVDLMDLNFTSLQKGTMHLYQFLFTCGTFETRRTLALAGRFQYLNLGSMKRLSSGSLPSRPLGSLGRLFSPESLSPGGPASRLRLGKK